MPFIVPHQSSGNEMTMSNNNRNATVTSVSNINFYYLKGNLVRSTIMLTGIKIKYQSLESIISFNIPRFLYLDKIRLTRRADIKFV